MGGGYGGGGGGYREVISFEKCSGSATRLTLWDPHQPGQHGSEYTKIYMCFFVLSFRILLYEVKTLIINQEIYVPNKDTDTTGALSNIVDN